MVRQAKAIEGHDSYSAGLPKLGVAPGHGAASRRRNGRRDVAADGVGLAGRRALFSGGPPPAAAPPRGRHLFWSGTVSRRVKLGTGPSASSPDRRMSRVEEPSRITTHQRAGARRTTETLDPLRHPGLPATGVRPPG